MGTQEVKLERVGEKSAVDSSDPVCSFIHNIIHNDLRPKSSGHVTHNSHKLQTKAIRHSTRRYMNRRELQSDQPIHVPLLRVLSFPPSDEHCRHSRAARTTPSNHTQRYASCNCSELRCYSNTLRRFVSPEPSTKPFKQRPEAQIAIIRYGLFGRVHCVGYR